MWKINWFTHLVSFTSEKTCVEDKLVFCLNIGKVYLSLEWLAFPVVTVDGYTFRKGI